MLKQEVINQIRMREQFISTRKRKPNRGKKLPVWHHPIAIETKYKNRLVKYIKDLYSIVKSDWVPAIPVLIEKRDILVNEDAVENVSWLESWPEHAQILSDATKVNFGEVTEELIPELPMYGTLTEVWNDKQWKKTLKAAFGVDIFHREPWLPDAINSWVKENTDLITTRGAGYHMAVDSIVQRGVRSGKHVRTIIKEIQKVTKDNINHARLIGRDQVSKLNGQLTRTRQKSIGVEKYIWHTSGDRRVRPTHRANDNEPFSWDDPPSDTGHPGEDFQCRCWAEAIFDDLLDEINPI